ncbi:MAG: helix-turn-helix domain-containing protein [Candidatus Micrarchaeota archaeon]
MEMQVLERIGLTKGEIKVYFSLLELGPTTTGPLVDASGVSSSKIYLVLDRLMKKGLASYSIQARKKHFEAADPRMIIDYLEEREKEITSQKKQLSQLLPELMKKRTLEKGKQHATVFRGMKGLDTAFRDILRVLKPGDEYYVLSAPEYFPESFQKFLGRFHKKREAKRIRMKIIYSENLKPTLGEDRESEKYTAVKYAPPGVITPAGIIIYNDKVMTVVWGREPIVSLIESSEYANSLKLFFKMLWEQETKTYRGLEGLASLLNDTLNYKEVMFIGGGGYFYDRLSRSYVKGYYEKAVKNGLRWRNIAIPKIRGHPVTKFPFAKTRYLSKPLRGPNVVWIWGNKVANVIWSKKPIAFLVENKEIANSYSKYFEMLWKTAER